MKTSPCFSSRRRVIAGSLGILLFTQGLWSVAVGQVVVNYPNRGTGLRGGASVVTYFNNQGGASVVTPPGSREAAARSGLNIPARSNSIRGNSGLFGRPNTYIIGGGYAYLGGYVSPESSTYIGGDYTVNYFSAPAPIIPRVSFNYAPLRRSGITYWERGSMMTVDGFASGLPEESWPRGPLLHSYWNDDAMIAAATNINFLLGRVSNMAVSAPQRLHFLPVDYLAVHPLVYFPQPGQFVLNYSMSNVLRRKMRNGGVFVFDDYPGNPHRMDYLNQIRRQFSDFEVSALSLDNPITPGFFTVLLTPRPAVVDGVRQSTFTIVSETAAPNNSGYNGISVSCHFGADGQVIILAN